jgi:hypothetical protein
MVGGGKIMGVELQDRYKIKKGPNRNPARFQIQYPMKNRYSIGKPCANRFLNGNGVPDGQNRPTAGQFFSKGEIWPVKPMCQKAGRGARTKI